MAIEMTHETLMEKVYERFVEDVGIFADELTDREMRRYWMDAAVQQSIINELDQRPNGEKVKRLAGVAAIEFTKRFIQERKRAERLSREMDAIRRDEQPSAGFTAPEEGAVEIRSKITDEAPREGTPSVFQETEHMTACREALNDFLGRRISHQNDVWRFRRHLTNGFLGSQEEVWQFLTSDHARLFSFDALEAWGIDPMSCQSEVTGNATMTEATHRDFAQEYGTVRPRRPIRQIGSFPGASSEQFVYSVRLHDGDGRTIAKTATHHADEYVALALHRGAGQTFVWSESYLRRHYIPRTLPTGHRRYDAIGHTVDGFTRSIVGWALDIARKINDVYRWSVEDALVFLCSNRLPRTGCVRGMYHNYPHEAEDFGAEASYGVVEMVVSPWVHPDVIREFYKRLPPRLTGKSSLPDMGRLELFRFVNETFDDLTVMKETENGTVFVRPKWKDVLAEWLVLHPFYKPEASPKARHNNFVRDYMETKKALLPPVSLGEAFSGRGRKPKNIVHLPGFGGVRPG